MVCSSAQRLGHFYAVGHMHRFGSHSYLVFPQGYHRYWLCVCLLVSSGGGIKRKGKGKYWSSVKEGCAPGNATWNFFPHSFAQNLATKAGILQRRLGNAVIMLSTYCIQVKIVDLLPREEVESGYGDITSLCCSQGHTPPRFLLKRICCPLCWECGHEVTFSF